MISKLTRMARLAPLALAQRRFPYRDPGAIRRVQERRIARIVEHAYQQVPHYRDEMDRLGLAPGDLRTASDLGLLPILERAQVRGEGDRLISRNLGQAVPFNSSGRTGIPITTVWDREAVLAHLGYRERTRAVMTSIIGRRFGYRESSFSLLGGTGKKVYETRTDALWLPRFVMDRQHLPMRDGPAANVAEMIPFDPHLVRSYGSYLEVFFLELERQGKRPDSLRVAEFAGDAIGEEARRRIEERFEIPVIGVYNAHETLDIAFECEHRAGYHVNVDICPVRIVDSAGRDLPDGEVGDVVVSNLVNRGTVLINYRIGDRGAILPGGCRCGRKLPLLDLAEGRVNAWIRMDNGRPVHGMDIRIVLKDEPDVRQFRIVQVDTNRLAVSVVPELAADPDALRGRISEGLQDLVGPGAAIEVEFKDHIPPSHSGKRQEIVSLIE